jgi:acyl-CoA dehydrogenase
MAGAVSALAEYCGSSALVLAMHGIQVASVIRHAEPAGIDRIVPGLLSGELLLANANSEIGLGGDRRTSICALEKADGGFRLQKRAATVSYGEDADGVLATARRDPDSPANEQVLVVCLPPALSMEPTGDWNTLGMRGTRSRPCLIDAVVAPELVIENYGDVFARTALPVSVVLLSSVWLGLAEAAGRRAHAMVRGQARRLRGSAPDAPPPPSAMRLAELGVALHQLRAVLTIGAEDYENAKDSDELTSLGFSGRMDNLKLASSTLVLDVVKRAMSICGMAGYANDSPFSMGRVSRDAAAAPLMINNDRVLTAISQSLLIRKDL